MARLKRDVYTSRFFRTGQSWAVVIPPDLIDVMKLNPGDMIAMNFQFGVCWMVKLQPHMIVSRETVSKVFESLFSKTPEPNEHT